MTRWTEDMIKERLDGTFTRVTYDGKIITEEDSQPKVVSTPWTPLEDDMIHQMRLRNRPWPEIAWMINRGEEATIKRYRVLRASGRVCP